MRMAIDEFVREPVEHVVDRESPFFLRHLRVEQHLQEQITKLAAKFIPIAIVDRFEDFISFLKRVWLDGIERLLAVPRAAAGAAQLRHDGNRSLEEFAG